jgi:hypothetical protein
LLVSCGWSFLDDEEFLVGEVDDYAKARVTTDELNLMRRFHVLSAFAVQMLMPSWKA